MTKRITLVFDLPDDDVKQVEDMLSEILATFDGKVFQFKVRNPAINFGNLLDNQVVPLLPAEVIVALQDKVNCDLIPNWNKNFAEHNMRELLDIEIMIDFLSDNLMDEMLRR